MNASSAIGKPKFALFDIDGTPTSELDGKVPQSAADALRRAADNGHKLFLCSGRSLYNIEQAYFDLGMSGAVMGCGTHVVADGRELLHVSLTPQQTRALLMAARETGVDILLEAAHHSAKDSRPYTHPEALANERMYQKRGIPIVQAADSPDFYADKLCAFAEPGPAIDRFLAVAKAWLSPIMRGNGMYELVPTGYSKASGIDCVLQAYGASRSDVYAFGDSENDRAMLQAIPNSVVMGNAKPESLKNIARYIAPKASEGGLARALSDLGFL